MDHQTQCKRGARKGRGGQGGPLAVLFLLHPKNWIWTTTDDKHGSTCLTLVKILVGFMVTEHFKKGFWMPEELFPSLRDLGMRESVRLLVLYPVKGRCWCWIWAGTGRAEIANYQFMPDLRRPLERYGEKDGLFQLTDEETCSSIRIKFRWAGAHL